MSVQRLAAVFEHSRTKGVTRLVLLSIANYEGERGAWPSIDTIAKDARCSVRAVSESIHRAEAAGELEVAYKKGPRGTNLYRTLPNLHGADTRAPRQKNTDDPADSRRESAPEPLGTESSTSSLSRRPRNPAFDALAEETNHDPRALTRSAAGLIGSKLAEIVDAERPEDAPEAVLRPLEDLAEEIRYRAARFRRLHPTWDLTPGSLAKWWPTLGRPKDPELPGPVADELGDVEPVEPPWVSAGLTYQRWLEQTRAEEAS